MPMTPEELQAHLDKTLDKLSAAVEKQDAEIKSLGGARETTGKKIDEIDKQVAEILRESVEAKEVLDTFLAEQKRISQAPPGERRRSLGEILIESPEFKHLGEDIANGRKPDVDRLMNVEVKGGFGPYIADIVGPPLMFAAGRGGEVKQLTSGAASAGALIDPQRDRAVITLPILPTPRLRNLIPVVEATTGSVQYVRETNFFNLRTQLNGAILAAAVSAVVDNAEGFYVGQTVTLSPGLAAEEDVVLTAVTYATNTIEFAATTNPHADSANVVSDTFVGTPETNLKPNMEATYDLVTDPILTLAHWIPASRQILEDAPGLRALVDNRGMEGLTLAEERQLLYGANDGSREIRGILTDPDIQTYLWSSGIPGDTRIDATRRGMTRAMLAHFAPDGVVIHPLDWERIELQKGSDGHYIWLRIAQGTGNIMFRMNVVPTTAIDQGTGLVGAFRLGSTIRNRMSANMRLSEHHADFFARNMVAILFEERVAQSIYRPPSFVEVTFNSAP